MASLQVQCTKLFIDNKFVDSINKKTFPTENPATEEKIADVAEAEEVDVDVAVRSSKKAFERGSKWRSIDASERGKLLYKLADLMKKNIDYLSKLETLDNGKTVANSILDIEFSIDCLIYYAGIADKIHGRTIPADGAVFSYTREEPIGVAAAIIPWNYPIAMAIWKIAPAVAAGCTMVLKPAEQTPLTALYLGKLIAEAGFPPGVVNIVPGFGPIAGAALAKHTLVDKIAFTGSTEVGHLIMEAAGVTNLKKVTLELGGKSPVVVFKDADLDAAVAACSEGVFTNHGQCCCAATRTFVQEEIYEEFLAKSKELAEKRKVGDPFSAETIQGPQIDKVQLEKIVDLVESGKKEGARLVCGGNRISKPGYFFQPTVFADVKDDMRIAKEEIFGPVQQIMKFKTLDEAIERANATTYGLGAGIFTNDINTATIFAQAVEAGSVWINTYDAVTPQTPFGGFKMSGIGKELGIDSVKEYLQTKCVTMAIPKKLS